MAVSLIIRDAHIVTMTAPDSRAQALAVADGRIVAVGSNDEIAALAAPATRVLSLPGRTVLPGFIDSHVHFTQTGLGDLGPHLYGVTGTAEALATVAAAAQAAPAGQLLLVHGCALTDLDRPLTRADLDAVDAGHPIMVGDVGAHGCVLNSRALELLALPDLPGLERDSGLLTGEANTRARYDYYNAAIGDDTRALAQHRAAQMAAAVGITTVHALEGGSPDGRGWLPQRDAEILLREQARLPVRTVLYFQSIDVQQALVWKLPRIGGCIWVDGAYGEHTAALQEPYHDCPGCRGRLYFADDELDAFVLRAHCAGLQISLHAIGDAAIEQALNAYERAAAAQPREHRHRIEHFSLPTAAQIARAARLGVAVGMQPNFAELPDPPPAPDAAEGLPALLGPQRYARRHPYRRIVDSGVLVAGGSDADPKPMGPLIGVQALVSHPEAERRLSVYEALTLYTVNGARIAFEEHDKGSIETGKLADLVVLGADPFATAPARLAQIPIEQTIVGGEVVYDYTRAP